MSVEADEDQFGLSEDDQNLDDPETNSQGHIVYDKGHRQDYKNNRLSHNASAFVEYNSDEESVKIMPILQQERLQQIKDINDEMLVKLTELRDLMSSGGMEASSKFVQENFLRFEDPPTPQGQSTAPSNLAGGSSKVRDQVEGTGIDVNNEHGRTIRFERHLISQMVPKNTNCNHRASHNSSLQSKSAETIYHNAVEKRISSSSDEFIDTSDENMDFIADFQPDYDNVGQHLAQNEYEGDGVQVEGPQLGTSSQG